MANSYVRGQLVRVAAKIERPIGTDVDPTTGPTCRYRSPAGVTAVKTYPTDAEVVKDSVGDFHLDIDANAEGRWHYRWEGTGTNQGAAEAYFDVVEGPFA
jgi:hypothetical protein